MLSLILGDFNQFNRSADRSRANLIRNGGNQILVKKTDVNLLTHFLKSNFLGYVDNLLYQARRGRRVISHQHHDLGGFRMPV